jgi:hypothetical protein
MLFELPRWDSRCTLRQHRHVQTQLALMAVRRTAHTDALLIEGLILNQEWAALCDFELNYTEHDAHSARWCRQALAYFSKDASLELGIDKSVVARRKFDEAEVRCLQTNDIFRAVSSRRFSFSPRVEAVLFQAQRKIAHILGDVPSLEALKLHFGPGATTQVPRRKASPRAKLGQAFACSEDLAPWASRLLEQMPSWLPWRENQRWAGPLHEEKVFSTTQEIRREMIFQDMLRKGQDPESYDFDSESDSEPPARSVVRSPGGDSYMPHSSTDEYNDEALSVPVLIVDGHLHFVPKTAKTFRTIIVEPSLNTMVQLGIGEHIAGRLRREGVDIRDQAPNQRFALEGSLHGGIATLDLSSASDTVATELVAALLPLDWFCFLKAFRSSHVLDADGNRLTLQKFSSMGNGFTFPLETLIFYALSKACNELSGNVGPVRAYGDDIIVPTGDVQLLSEVLNAVGFVLNGDKSFSTGPFRESCGKDYFLGIDIRPVYLHVKEKPHRLAACDLFSLHNFFVEHDMHDERIFILSLLAPEIRIFGPAGYGDGHLVGDWLPRRHNREHGYTGFTFETFAWKPLRSDDLYPGDRVLPSYSIYENPPNRGLADLDVDLSNVRWETIGHWGGPRAASHKWVKGRIWVDTPGRGTSHRIKIYVLR